MSTTTLQRLRGLSFRAIIAVVFAFLLLPVVIVVLTSFTTQTCPAIPHEGFSLEWYEVHLQEEYRQDTLTVSLGVATASAVLSAII